jgi:NitT/TauT family transport system substrate-binding protein
MRFPNLRCMKVRKDITTSQTHGSWRRYLAAGLVSGLMLVQPALAVENVKVSLFSWPGYSFWFIAKEKNLVPDLQLDIQIIEDPYQSFSLMSAGQLDVTSSTAEYGPIALDRKVPIKFVAYTNPSYGTDKIIVAPGIKTAKDLVGKQVAVMEGGLTQIFMGMWLEQNGVSIKDVKFSNLVMDQAVGALVGGAVAGGEFWEPFGAQALTSLPGSRVMAESSDPAWSKAGVLADGMYMSADFLGKRPKAAALTMRAYFAAVDWWRAHPAEGNKIIAKAIGFSAADVEAVIGKDGTPHKGGIVVFDRQQAASFMGLTNTELPFGMHSGQIADHWNTVSQWWVKFGLIGKSQDWQSGIALAPLKAALAP